MPEDLKKNAEAQLKSTQALAGELGFLIKSFVESNKTLGAGLLLIIKRIQDFEGAVKDSAGGTAEATSAFDYFNTASTKFKAQIGDIKKMQDDLFTAQKQENAEKAVYQENLLAASRSGLLKQLEQAREMPGVTEDEIQKLNKLIAQLKSVGGVTDKTTRSLTTLHKNLSMLGLPAPQILKTTEAIMGLGKIGVVGAGLWAGFFEVLRQMFIQAGDTTQRFTAMTQAGGLMSGAIQTAGDTTKKMTGWMIDDAASAKVMNSILEEYGLMTNDMVAGVDASTGAIRQNAQTQHDLFVQLGATSMMLAKMGPIYNIPVEQIGKMMGGVLSRFHTPMKNAVTLFDSLGLASRGSGIHLNSFLELLTASGEQLRYVNVSGDTVALSFMNLTRRMIEMNGHINSFWRDLQPGEMLEMMKGIVEAGKSMAPATYLALRPGPVPQTMPEFAAGIRDFMREDPFSRMKIAADRYVAALERTGQDETTAMTMAGTLMSEFSKFGTLGPLMVETLHGMSGSKFAGGKGTDEFFKEMTSRFPDQKANIESLRNLQMSLQDPLGVIAHSIVALLRLATNWASTGILKGVSGEGFKSAEQERQFIDSYVYPGSRRSDASKRTRRD